MQAIENKFIIKEIRRLYINLKPRALKSEDLRFLNPFFRKYDDLLKNECLEI